MKGSENRTYGVKMKKYCRAHEAWISAQPSTQKNLDLHLKKLEWIQHERLVHLIVTVLVSLAELFVVGIVLFRPELGIIPAIIMIGVAVLLGFYFYHYFFLENTVQRWYLIAERMMKDLDDSEEEDTCRK